MFSLEFWIFEENRHNAELNPSLNIGVRGLHIVHNSFQYGETASHSSIRKLINAIFKIFDVHIRSPTRCTDWKEHFLFKNKLFSLILFAWVDSDIVEKKKPQVIWPKMSKVFYFRKPLPKSKQRGWGEQRENRSYDTLIFNLCDPLSVAEISFVEKTAKKFNGFLVTFQTSAQRINSVS